MTATAKDVPLEAARGVAALVVVANHSMLGFLPKYCGIVPEFFNDRLQGNPLYVLINGSGAVSFFFVLSGYILTRRYCLSGDVQILLKGAIKRWPRLMGPVLAAVLVSYLLFRFHLYRFEDAGRASGSSWLIKFASAWTTPVPIHLVDAIKQGTFLTFFRGDWLFDSSLWTMHPEFVGSFVAFGFAPILLAANRSSAPLTIGLLLIALTILFYYRSDLVAFPLGVGLAVMLPRTRGLPVPWACLGLVAAIYLLGYPGQPSRAYQLFASLAAGGMPATYPQIAGAAVMLAVLETCSPFRKALSGRVAAFLGELSFPIYLLHVLVICSIGSAVYLKAGAVPAIATAFVVSITVSLPLMRFNQWWVGQVNRFAVFALRQPAARRPDPPVTLNLLKNERPAGDQPVA